MTRHFEHLPERSGCSSSWSPASRSPRSPSASTTPTGKRSTSPSQLGFVSRKPVVDYSTWRGSSDQTWRCGGHRRPCALTLRLWAWRSPWGCRSGGGIEDDILQGGQRPRVWGCVGSVRGGPCTCFLDGHPGGSRFAARQPAWARIGLTADRAVASPAASPGRRAARRPCPRRRVWSASQHAGHAPSNAQRKRRSGGRRTSQERCAPYYLAGCTDPVTSPFHPCCIPSVIPPGEKPHKGPHWMEHSSRDQRERNTERYEWTLADDSNPAPGPVLSSRTADALEGQPQTSLVKRSSCPWSPGRDTMIGGRCLMR